MEDSEGNQWIGTDEGFVLKGWHYSSRLELITLGLPFDHVTTSYFDLEGNSNYAFPLVLKQKRIDHRDKLESILKKKKIEFRRGNAGGGNQLRQPYLKKFVKKINLSKFKEVDHIHFFGYYIGNYPSLKKEKIITICNILNKIEYEK